MEHKIAAFHNLWGQRNDGPYIRQLLKKTIVDLRVMGMGRRNR